MRGKSTSVNKNAACAVLSAEAVREGTEDVRASVGKRRMRCKDDSA